jgi:hypothetical protein
MIAVFTDPGGVERVRKLSEVTNQIEARQKPRRTGPEPEDPPEEVVPPAA